MSQNDFHLAQINIARARASLDDPVMEGFVSQLEEVNALADESPGFVWRLADQSGNAATDIHAFDDELILVNMSVWESLEALREFSYRGRHASLLRDRGKWFEPGGTQITLWWIAAGSLQSVEDAKRKLELLEANGPTPVAFTFKNHFPPPG